MTLRTSPSMAFRSFAPFLLLVLVGAAQAASPNGGTIHRFQGASDGSYPEFGLVADQAGNLYGTTESGDCNGCGVVFELVRPAPGGTWTKTSLYRFLCKNDGCDSFGSLIFDQAGNLYGTTMRGGDHGEDGGTVFELIPPSQSGGSWTHVVLHSFNFKDNDGAEPMGTIVFDKSGNLYGATGMVGDQFTGTVFQLAPPSTAGALWTETVLYTFQGSQSGDGANPFSGVIIDNEGALYGTTEMGGCPACIGTVFKLSPPSVPGGIWTEQVLHSFGSQLNDGISPQSGVVLDGAGNLYGTTPGGGNNTCGIFEGCGTVFQLTAPTSGEWTETILHNFSADENGFFPRASLLRDPSGVLYGTASRGGNVVEGVCEAGCGTVFSLIPPTDPGGGWTENLLHAFSGGLSGASPQFGALIHLGNGLYGTTAWGGGPGGTALCQTTGCGTAFEVILP